MSHPEPFIRSVPTVETTGTGFVYEVQYPSAPVAGITLLSYKDKDRAEHTLRALMREFERGRQSAFAELRFLIGARP